jgi:hypothetical protein
VVSFGRRKLNQVIAPVFHLFEVLFGVRVAIRARTPLAAVPLVHLLQQHILRDPRQFLLVLPFQVYVTVVLLVCVGDGLYIFIAGFACGA